MLIWDFLNFMFEIIILIIFNKKIDFYLFSKFIKVFGWVGIVGYVYGIWLFGLVYFDMGSGLVEVVIVVVGWWLVVFRVLLCFCSYFYCYGGVNNG